MPVPNTIIVVGVVAAGVLLLILAFDLWAWLLRNPRELPPPPADNVDPDDPDDRGLAVPPDDQCRLGSCLDHEHCTSGGTCEQVGAALNVPPTPAPLVRPRLHYRFPRLPSRKDR